MKTQNYAKQMKTALFGALAAIMLMTTACDKKNDNNNVGVPVAPIYPGNCVTGGCVGGVGVGGGQLLYGGQTINSNMAQAQFQVYGNTGGNGAGSITGVVAFNNFMCQVGVPNLTGSYQIQMTQQGTLQADTFQGYVGLMGPQGTIQAGIQVVPTRTQGTGLFSMYVCNQRIDMNF